MTKEALAQLAANAKAFSTAYVALAEALMQDGVIESLARQEARAAAVIAAMYGSQEDDAPCPLCGRVQT
jgi:pyrroline-5-carboxylate reductase